MRYSAYVGCAIAAVLVASCSNTPDNGKVADDVKAAMEGVIAGLNARDAAKATAANGPGYIGMFHGTNNTSGAAQNVALTAAQLIDPTAKIEVGSPEINVAAAGDMAIWNATYVYTHTDPATKAPKTENGNWVVVFRRQPDASLKASLGVISDTAPANAASSPV